ncbi:hypothetical protein KVT40_003379 [Elsinoe batatas]|uniref:Uncharacterized protein n=1 Tax=Elsinoe batatas TaxID=2601811 RepID=A0A8K0L6R7_9PEZI|nr:hypothetical protein KVT40_003379 [Elsinoe batatas]
MSGIPNPLQGMTFQSGWDSCMARAYCKWPVIVGIVIGSLIVLSVLYCVVQILCCGAQCCFCFASIAKCLCCGCCRGSGSSTSRPPRDQYVSPLAHGNPYGTQKSGYVNPAQFESGFGQHARGPSNSNAGVYSGGVGYAGQGQYRSQPPPKYATATFDEPSRTNGDTLPAMPSWGEARSTRVLKESSPQRPGDVEMGRLNSEGSLPKFESDDYRGRDSAHGDGPGVGAAAAVGAGAGAAAAGAYGYGRQNSYSSGAGSGYGNQGQGHRQQQDSPYAQRDTYGNVGFGQNDNTSPYGQRQPQNHSPTYDQGTIPYGYERSHNPPAHDPYSQHTQAPAPARSPQQGYSSYNPPQPTQSPAYAAYPGQNNYQSTDALSSQGTGQGNYYGQNPDFGSIGRRPVQGSWKDL